MRFTSSALVLGVAVLVAACGGAAASGEAPSSAGPTADAVVASESQPPTTDGTGSPAAASPGADTGEPAASPSPTVPTGFAFGADAVLAYYQDAGLTCGAPEPSAVADGWIVRECRGRDADGRTLVIGVVTDGQGEIGDGYASVTAKKGEAVIGPEEAIDHLSGFLGAMLGETRATGLLEWLAGSMGNAYEETMDGDALIATYRQPSDDTRTIWLEVAGPGYPAQPAP